MQNIAHENELIFKRMNVPVQCIFIWIVLHKDSFCHRGKSQLSDLPTLKVWPWDSWFGMPTHGLTVLPLNLTVNQKVLNCQTIPEGMQEYREICAHNSRIFISSKLNCEGNGGNARVSLQPWESWCDRDPPHHQRIAGAPRHSRLENEPKCEKSSKRVQQRALIRQRVLWNKRSVIVDFIWRIFLKSPALRS